MRTHRKLTSHERDKIAYWYAVGKAFERLPENWEEALPVYLMK
jgi:hypothetical protein